MSEGGSWSRNVRSLDKYFLPGVTWANSAWRLRVFGSCRGWGYF